MHAPALQFPVRLLAAGIAALLWAGAGPAAASGPGGAASPGGVAANDAPGSCVAASTQPPQVAVDPHACLRLVNGIVQEIYNAIKPLV